MTRPVEDFEDEQLTPAAPQQPEQLTNHARAHRLAESVLTQPLDDDQATALAAVYATLAVADAIAEALKPPLTAEQLEENRRAIAEFAKPAERRTTAQKPTAPKSTK